VARAANCEANILIRGETGTGKELFARAIHQNSSRAQKNFVVIDCGALPKSLVESILFGYEKGAFTGAEKDKEGLIKQADGGTLFLDEIGELPLSMQKTLLRVLQERCFLNVGGTREIESDFRLVSASIRNLDEMVKLGSFRGDLLFRLRSITIDLPPLRFRNGDIKEIILDYTKKLCRLRKVSLKRFSPEVLEMLESYSWPGNVRELFSTIESSLANALYEPTIFPKHLPANIRIQLACNSLQDTLQHDLSSEKSEASSEDLPKWQDFRRAHIEEGERRYLRTLIAQVDGDIRRASQLSGLSQPRLYELLRKYSISA
jgi:two-component system NtrC family response regulator